MTKIGKTKSDYCNYCKQDTKHEYIEENYMKCMVCGSGRMDKIQGFNAVLM